MRFDRIDASGNRDGGISRRDLEVFLDLTARPPEPAIPGVPSFTKQTTVPYPGKQDDIYFVNAKTGWYVNGTQGADKSGRIYKTEDGGVTWNEQRVSPGTFFRCVGFVDELHGFAGNIGPDYFPNVSDTTSLYETHDGGKTWSAVTNISGPLPTGLCAIDVAKVPFVHSGHTEYKTLLHAAGRVGGPAHLMRSEDEGKSWTSQDMSAHMDFITDVKFLNDQRGFVIGATIVNGEPRGVIVATEDGGKSWNTTYMGTTAATMWKVVFPTSLVGYATILSTGRAERQAIAKTVDGGKTWSELPLVDNPNANELGVGFIDEKRGWVGTTAGGFYTADGGASWVPAPGMGNAVNKIRLVPRPDGSTDVIAIGVNVSKTTLAPTDTSARAAHLRALRT